MYDPPAAPPPPQSEGPLSLEMERAEFADKDVARCAACRERLAGSYYEIGGRICCAACHERVITKIAAKPGGAGFLRAAAAGVGAGVAGAVLYLAVRAATGYDFSLISILVGYMVGRAVHWGVRGYGGWLYQGLAVVLTYLAIVSVYIPGILVAMRHRTEARAVAVAGSTPGTGAALAPGGTVPGTPAGRKAATPRPGPLRSLLVLAAAGVFLLGVAAALPFLGGIHVLGLFIIAIGLFEAGKLNRRVPLNISGPHAIAPSGWRA